MVGKQELLSRRRCCCVDQQRSYEVLRTASFGEEALKKETICEVFGALFKQTFLGRSSDFGKWGGKTRRKGNMSRENKHLGFAPPNIGETNSVTSSLSFIPRIAIA